MAEEITTTTPLTHHITIPNTTVSIPRLGFGVYKIPPKDCQDACRLALAAGYRHIDCAKLYRSEAQVAAAVAHSGLARSQVFLTTKIKQWPSNGDLYESLLSSVRNLGGCGEDEEGAGWYVDLFLVHTPRLRGVGSVRPVWAALERLQDEGRTRAIGVSNFGVSHIEEMREYATVWPPSVNQIEQRELVKYCRDHSIVIQAYSPLATGARLDNLTLRSIAEKHDRSPAQTLIRYSLQKGWIPLPKSQDPERIRENMDVFTFELDRDDMESLDNLDEGADGARFPANVMN